MARPPTAADAIGPEAHPAGGEPAWYADFKQSIDPLDRVSPGGDEAGDLEGELIAPEALDSVSFVRRARRRAAWQHPATQGLMAVLAVALLLLLAAQIGLHERDRIAAISPQLRPYIDRVCQPLGCAVAAPMQIESIVIDSSSLNRLRSDGYQLSLTLRNQAGIPVAMPWLELTLTDTGEQPVLRRVISPADLGAPAVLPANGDWSAALALNITSEVAAGRIAGYRALAFYP